LTIYKNVVAPPVECNETLIWSERILDQWAGHS